MCYTSKMNKIKMDFYCHWEGRERKVSFAESTEPWPFTWNLRKLTVSQVRPQETPVKPHEALTGCYQHLEDVQGKTSSLLFSINKLKWLWFPHFFHGILNFHMTPLGCATDHPPIVSEVRLLPTYHPSHLTSSSNYLWSTGTFSLLNVTYHEKCMKNLL